MRRSFRHIAAIFLLIPSLMLACSLTIPSGSSTGTSYRFDELPSKTNESSAISEYRTISAWDKNDITYSFANGTDQLQGNTERDVIRQAFGLWAAQTPLTFTETDNSSSADNDHY